MYGDGYVGKIKPSGELYKERQLSKGLRSPRNLSAVPESSILAKEVELKQAPNQTETRPLDPTALNKLRAQMMKAKLKKDPNAATLEAEYNAAMATAANRTQPDVVVLNAMDNRMLAGGRQGEVKAIDNKRGRERGLVEENEDMSIEDMVRQERRTKTQNGGMVFAERIAKDAKFDVRQSNRRISPSTSVLTRLADRPRLHGRQRPQTRSRRREVRNKPPQHSRLRLPKDVTHPRYMPTLPSRRQRRTSRSTDRLPRH